MVLRIRVVALLTVLCPLAISATAESTTPSADDVRALLRASGNADIAAQIAPIAAQQFTFALHKANQSLSPRVDQIVTNVVVSYLRERAEQDHFMDRLIPIYSKHLTKADVRQLTQFYQSQVGRKLVSVIPAISQETVKVGQEWGQSILPALQTQLLDKLKQEKLIE
jgi:hypothetical protein